jgi:hypothetical protein
VFFEKTHGMEIDVDTEDVETGEVIMLDAGLVCDLENVNYRVLYGSEHR